MKLRYEVLGENHYRLLDGFTYVSPRYQKRITCEESMVSDGATGAFDIYSKGWWVHDKACSRATWDDESPITAWQAAMVIGDILKAEGQFFRSIGWPVATFLFGCLKTRQNGWF